ncbi:ribosomal protein L4 [Serendipita vermifera]|nr:ribosomal protein L4 [Serendipita vermifera]
MKMPFIPVKANYKSKAPSWLPVRAFCGSFEKDTVVHLNPTVFSHPIRRDVLHACVTWYRDSLRRGTASTKSRGEVRGSNRKIRPQKGTGRARLGDRGSPMLRGGGVAFGPKPRDFSTELPRKVREMGMRVALSAKLRERKLIVVPSVDWPNWKTKFAAGRIKGLAADAEKGCLIVSGTEAVPAKLAQATRNLNFVTCKSAKDLQVWDVLRYRYTVLSLDAVQWFQDNLGKATLGDVADVEGKSSDLEQASPA